MTNEDIIRMARSAGFGVLLPSVHYRGEIHCGDDVCTDEMERFAALVAAHERGECARVCDEVFEESNNYCFDASHCAEAIRARGGKA